MKQLFAYVPSNVVTNFISNHIGENKDNDNYFSKVSFLGNGQIATRGRLFGMTDSEISQVGLSSLPSGKNSIGAYLVELAGKYDTLNGDLNTSVKSYVGEAITNLVNGAPTALDTLGEIATLLTDNNNLNSFAYVQAQVGIRPTNTGDNGATIWSGDLYAYAAYVANYKVSTLDVSDTAVDGQYISQITETDGKISVTRANLPTLSVKSGSGNYVAVAGTGTHEIEILTSSIASTTGFVHNTTGTAYTVGAAESIENGLVTASVVYSRLRADETFVASALSTLDTKINDVVTATTNALDSTILISDTNSYVSAHIIEEDGKLKASGSYLTFNYAKIYDQLDSTLTITATENSTTYGTATIAIADGKLTSTGSSFTINKANILAKTETTISSPTTGTGENAYVKVNVVTENHDVKSVIVEFDPWEVYSAD